VLSRHLSSVCGSPDASQQIRQTTTVAFVYPGYKIPVSSSLPRKLVSASSISKVGSSSSIARKKADELMFDDTAARSTKWLSTVTSVEFPHSFSGDSIPM